VLASWSDVHLTREPTASGTGIKVPEAALNLEDGSRPSRVLIRPPGSDKPTVVADAEWFDGAFEQTAAQVSSSLLTSLKMAGNAVNAPARIKRATAADRLRYDNSARIAALTSLLAVVAASWGVVNEATGESHGWIKIVIAAVALVASIVAWRS
jgi:hypothetical protein